MMANTIIIRTKQDYWHDFVLTGLDKRLTKDQIKTNILDAFRKEIFDQVSLFIEPANLQGADPAVQKRVQNIVKQAGNKLYSLCKLCNKYKETYGMIKPSDILSIEIDLNNKDSAKNTLDNEEL